MDPQRLINKIDKDMDDSVCENRDRRRESARRKLAELREEQDRRAPHDPTLEENRGLRDAETAARHLNEDRRMFSESVFRRSMIERGLGDDSHNS